MKYKLSIQSPLRPIGIENKKYSKMLKLHTLFLVCKNKYLNAVLITIKSITIRELSKADRSKTERVEVIIEMSDQSQNKLILCFSAVTNNQPDQEKLYNSWIKQLFYISISVISKNRLQFKIWIKINKWTWVRKSLKFAFLLIVVPWNTLYLFFIQKNTQTTTV